MSSNEAEPSAPPDPVDVFDSFSKEGWWDPKGRLRTLHWITPLRFEYFEGKATEKFGELGGLTGKKVLDIGCGGGLLSERFAEAGATVIGIDLSPSAIGAAKAHAREGGLKIDYRVVSVSGLKEDIEAKGKGATPFDCIVCSEVLEHLDDPASFIDAACGLLKRGGLFFFSTINKTLKARLLMGTLVEDLLGLLPRGTHDPKRFLRPSELARTLRENSVVVEDVKGMGLDVLGLKFKLTKDTSVNYIGYGVKGG